MGKNTKSSNLGRSLIRDRFGNGSRRTVDNNSMVSIMDFEEIVIHTAVTCISQSYAVPHNRSARWLRLGSSKFTIGH